MTVEVSWVHVIPLVSLALSAFAVGFTWPRK